MMNVGKRSLLIIALAALGGCSSYSFIPTGLTQENLASKPEDCGAKVLLHAPKHIKFTEVGICRGEALGGGIISDNTPEAVEELQECACEHGGDAIILTGTGDAGNIPAWGGYSQQTARATGIVIVFDKDE